MKDQHTLIKGYRDLSQHEIDLMNEVKSVAVQVGDLCDKLGKSVTELGIDGRWLAIGKTDLQTGFMALVRSIARPQTF